MLGETGENSNSWFYEVSRMLEARNYGGMCGPTKSIDTHNCAAFCGNKSRIMKLFLKLTGERGPKPTTRSATQRPHANGYRPSYR